MRQSSYMPEVSPRETTETKKNHLLSDLSAFFSARPGLNNTPHAVIISHAHIDHTKLLMAVLQNFKVKFFYDGGDVMGRGAAQLKKARKFVSTNGIKYLAIRFPDFPVVENYILLGLLVSGPTKSTPAAGAPCVQSTIQGCTLVQYRC